MANTELRRQPAVVKNFFDSASDAFKSLPDGNRKTRTAEAAKSLLSAGIEIPKSVDILLSKYADETHGVLLDSVIRGAEHYQREHGFAPDAGLIETALHNAIVASTNPGELGIAGFRMDSATDLHHDQLSLQPAQAMVAIMSQFAEAVPFAAYLPADVKSNEARLAIMSNKARSDFGAYLSNGSLDGVAGGGVYIDSERVCVLSTNGGGGTALTYTVTTQQSTAVGGVAVGGGNVAVPLLRGRTTLVVNGMIAGRETESYGSGSNSIAGSVVIAATTHTISGTVNSDTGAISITASPVLPAGTIVEALAYVDYERAPDVAPKIGTEVQVYKMYARASRVTVSATIDAMTQMQQELSLDPRGQALLSVRAQYAQERHYAILSKVLRIAANYAATWNYDAATQIAQKDRAQIFLNLAPILAKASQDMAIRTIDCGVSTLYVTGQIAAIMRGLPSTIWQDSGVPERAGIYRLGRLFSTYDVYYTPKGLTDNGTSTSQILCIGRASQTARNIAVFGEAVPAMFLPLAMQRDLVQSDAFYTRNFSDINPHALSAQAAALINVTGIAF